VLVSIVSYDLRLKRLQVIVKQGNDQAMSILFIFICDHVPRLEQGDCHIGKILSSYYILGKGSKRIILLC